MFKTAIIPNVCLKKVALSGLITLTLYREKLRMISLSLENQGAELLMKGHYQHALAFFERVLEDNPKEAYFHYGRGESLCWLALYNEKALESFELALIISPHNADILRGKGNILRVLNRNQEGLKCLEATLNMDPKNAEALLGILPLPTNY